MIDMGWADALRAMHPDDPQFTFWSYLRNRWPRDAGLRLDHLLLSPAIVPRLKAAGVDRDVRGKPEASDHAPAWIELKPKKCRKGHMSIEQKRGRKGAIHFAATRLRGSDDISWRERNARSIGPKGGELARHWYA